MSARTEGKVPDINGIMRSDWHLRVRMIADMIKTYKRSNCAQKVFWKIPFNNTSTTGETLVLTSWNNWYKTKLANKSHHRWWKMNFPIWINTEDRVLTWLNWYLWVGPLIGNRTKISQSRWGEENWNGFIEELIIDYTRAWNYKADWNIVFIRLLKTIRFRCSFTYT